MTNEKPRVVFDCMIFVQAVLSDAGPSAHLLDLLEMDVFTLFTSHASLAEVRAVLARPKLRAARPALTDELVEAFLARVSRYAVLLKQPLPVFQYPRDPKDEKYVNLAVAAKAAYIVSWDTDLLVLMTGYTYECKEFRRRFRPLQVIGPVEFLRSLETVG